MTSSTVFDQLDLLFQNSKRMRIKEMHLFNFYSFVFLPMKHINTNTFRNDDIAQKETLLDSLYLLVIKEFKNKVY